MSNGAPQMFHPTFLLPGLPLGCPGCTACTDKGPPGPDTMGHPWTPGHRDTKILVPNMADFHRILYIPAGPLEISWQYCIGIEYTN